MTALTPVTDYAPPARYVPATPGEQVDVLTALSRCSTVRYRSELWQLDAAGSQIADLSGVLQAHGGQVNRDMSSGTDVHGRLACTLAEAQAWGSAIVSPWLLAASPEFEGGQWQAYQLGAYVITTPNDDDLDVTGDWAVTGYDKLYLLQNQPDTSLSYAAGSTYGAALTDLFRRAGLLGSTAALATVCDYPADWYVKVLPKPSNYPLAGGATYLSAGNDLLDASGCRGLYTLRNGRFVIESTPDPRLQSQQWEWDASGAAAEQIVLAHQQQYAGDVWNAPNQWVFLQSGLTFQPANSDGTDGKYVVDNVSVPPAGQSIVGRVIRSTQTVDASGTADLKKQGDKIVTDALSGAEKISVKTVPWPAAWHFDVFQYRHPQLPGSAVRRVQARAWTLPLTGEAMSWDTFAVASL